MSDISDLGRKVVYAMEMACNAYENAAGKPPNEAGIYAAIKAYLHAFEFGHASILRTPSEREAVRKAIREGGEDG